MIPPHPAYSSAFEPDSLPAVPPILPEQITADWAWGDSQGAGVKVAVIDSGIEADHPGVPGAPIAGYVAIDEGQDGRITYDTTPHADIVGHGTACAGLIRSIAPECELHSVRVLSPTRGGKGSILAAGLTWAIENGMHICNLSLGTTKRDFFDTLHELADRAYFSNVVLVCAANNLPIPSFPSVFGSVISVACHRVPSGWVDPLLFYYNPRPPVEFGAAGIELLVPWRNGRFMTTSGNSFAAPHITGFVARMVGKHPGMTPFHVKAVLRELAANVSLGPTRMAL